MQGTRRRSLVVGAVAVVWAGVLGFTSDDPLGARGGSPVLETLVPVVPLLLGETVRARRELADRAVAEQEREAARRVEAERTRIARELHDVLAHTLAAVNVQTAAAVAAFDSHPEIARASLQQARASGKAALTELRATLNLLRDGDATDPSPTLARLDEIVETARQAGLDVSVLVDAPTDLADGVSLAAYRIVQEAVTNTIRHSDARRVEIAIRPDAGSIRIEVVDDGTARPPTTSHDETPSGGLGLLGMRERALALGGTLSSGHTGDGYRVAAVLPTGQADP